MNINTFSAHIPGLDKVFLSHVPEQRADVCQDEVYVFFQYIPSL